MHRLGSFYLISSVWTNYHHQLHRFYCQRLLSGIVSCYKSILVIALNSRHWTWNWGLRSPLGHILQLNMNFQRSKAHRIETTRSLISPQLLRPASQPSFRPPKEYFHLPGFLSQFQSIQTYVMTHNRPRSKTTTTSARGRTWKLTFDSTWSLLFVRPLGRSYDLKVFAALFV